jgi:hypothetical protein
MYRGPWTCRIAFLVEGGVSKTGREPEADRYRVHRCIWRRCCDASTAGNEKQKIIEAIENLNPGIHTRRSWHQAGVSSAQSKFIKGGNNRVIIATDGTSTSGKQ